MWVKALSVLYIFFFFLIMFSSCYQARALSAKMHGGAKWVMCTTVGDTVDSKQYVNVLISKVPKERDRLNILRLILRSNM